MSKKVLLHNHMALGDTVCGTTGIRDLKKQFPDWQIKMETNFMEVWDNNPYITNFEGKPDEEYFIGHKIVVQGSSTNGNHLCEGFRLCLEDRLKTKIKQGLIKPDLHLSEYEKNTPIFKGKYWVINIDTRKQINAKKWHDRRWQKVVDKLSTITFIQVGNKANNKYKLKGDNVINYIGKTNIRDLIRLIYHSQGCLSLVSATMHIAAAFDKPCVIVAGAREPVTFEEYPLHRYIHNNGTLPCSKFKPCWACSTKACSEKGGEVINGIPKCLDLITSNDVVNAVKSYYKGGRLEVKRGTIDKVKSTPLIKIVTNAHIYGGAEKSVVEIVKQAQNKGYQVDFIPRKTIHPEIMKQIKGTNITKNVTGECDVLLLYASDMVYDFHKSEFSPFIKLKAKKKVMALTYKLGKVLKEYWTRDWNLYLFLSSAMEDAFTEKWEKLMEEENKDSSYSPTYFPTQVLAPPIDLERFFKVKVDYKQPLHIVRHSSQGDNKYSTDINELINVNANFSFMPAPTFLKGMPNVTRYQYNELPVEEFLGKGSCFWYLLPDGYTDQGPRVIMEAMAAGLPVIAENRDGAKDRLDDSCGWLINDHSEAKEIINSLTPEILEEKGNNARKRAKEEFRREKWIEAITE